MSWKRKYIPILNLAQKFSKTFINCANYYKSLGLTPSATSADIKAAYYRLSKIYHPDRNNGSEASAKIFREISTAYEVLRNSESRRNYDMEKFRNFDTVKPNYGPRNKSYKRNRSNMGSAAKNSNVQDERWKNKSNASKRNFQKSHSRDVEDLLTKNLRNLFHSQWQYGNRHWNK
ncbi:UNVERIFIED_CONTAM: hypothetical protein PYX00_005259 [Menopon gallinae]|uniref:J domain-containing protein n=1 Tax=Menopon gallinae TaxID=328185 RepID=A0AAW2HRV6_9NEOP